eukprot:4234908-Pyramimonas_sp.AAC.1
MQHAAKLKVWVDAEHAAGRNPFSSGSQSSHTSWRDVSLSLASSQHRVRRSSKQCSTMATYVDDCELDAGKRHRTHIWDVIRVGFSSKAPEVVRKFLGCSCSVPRQMTLADGRTGVAVVLSQSEYCQRIVRDYEAVVGYSVRPVTTPAQQTTPPRPEDLAPAEAGTGRRRIIGEAFYAARWTRPDFSFAVGRLA